MMKREEGFGIGQSIVLLAFLVFLVIPLFTSLTGKVFVKYIVHRMNEATDIAVMTAVQELDDVGLSEGRLEFNNRDLLLDSIIGSISDNLVNGVEIRDYEIKIYEDGGTCSYGNSSEYDFVHCLVEFSFRGINGKPIDFFIHRDVEIPCGGKVR